MKKYLLTDVLTCHSWAYCIHENCHEIIKECYVLSEKTVKPPSISSQFLQQKAYDIKKSSKLCSTTIFHARIGTDGRQKCIIKVSKGRHSSVSAWVCGYLSLKVEHHQLNKKSHRFLSNVTKEILHPFL